MPTPPTPLDIARTVARILVPLGGILFLRWSAPSVLVLYFVDTMRAMAVMFAGLMRHFTPPTNQPGAAARVNAEVGYVAVALFLTAFISIPLGMPVYIILAASDVGLKELFADEAFGGGLVLQAIAAFVLVAVYVVAGIFIGVAPDKFLRAIPGGAEDADPLPGTPNAPPQANSWKARRKRKR